MPKILGGFGTIVQGNPLSLTKEGKKNRKAITAEPKP